MWEAPRASIKVHVQSSFCKTSWRTLQQRRVHPTGTFKGALGTVLSRKYGGTKAQKDKSILNQKEMNESKSLGSLLLYSYSSMWSAVFDIAGSGAGTRACKNVFFLGCIIGNYYAGSSKACIYFMMKGDEL